MYLTRWPTESAKRRTGPRCVRRILRCGHRALRFVSFAAPLPHPRPVPAHVRPGGREKRLQTPPPTPRWVEARGGAGGARARTETSQLGGGREGGKQRRTHARTRRERERSGTGHHHDDDGTYPALVAHQFLHVVVVVVRAVQDGDGVEIHGRLLVHEHRLLKEIGSIGHHVVVAVGRPAGVVRRGVAMLARACPRPHHARTTHQYCTPS